MTVNAANERERLAGLDGHTEGPWHLCAHLKDDEHCKCGYRGVVYGPDMDRPMAICQPGHDPDLEGQEGLGPVRYPREVERANARLIAAAPDLKRDYLSALDVIEAKDAEIERLREGSEDVLPAGDYLEGLEEGFAAAKADQAAEIKRLREAIERAVMTLPDDDERDDRVTEAANLLLGVVLGGPWRHEP